MDRILGFASLTGFILSLLVHIASLLGVDVAASFPLVWGLHVGIFAVFAPYVFSSRTTLGNKPSLAVLRTHFPMWVITVGKALMAYCVLNFILFMVGTEGGSPEIRDGKYLLLEHGKLIRELTQSQYQALKINELRGFSGHWLMFYYAPLAYFLFRRQPALSGSSAA